MAKKKAKPAEPAGESAPMWIVSFADLVTLLMSFFVILAVKPEGAPGAASDSDFAEVAAAIRAAFKHLPSPEASAAQQDWKHLAEQLVALAKMEGPLNKGDSREKGVSGKNFRVRKIRDGMEITMGGPVFFEPFAAKPTPEGERQLEQLVEIVKGHRNVIDVRGHAGEEPWPADWKYDDAMRLSYTRAQYVADRLIAGGTDPRALRLVAVGPNEPVARQAYDETQRGDNRRVEIIVRESLLDEYVGQPAAQPARHAASRPS